MPYRYYKTPEGDTIMTSDPREGFERISKEEAERLDKARGVAHLLSMLKPNDTVYTAVDWVARDGMSRCISLFIAREDQIKDITYWAALAMGDEIDRKHRGIKVGGIGEDKGFKLVYDLGRCLWPNGTPEPHGRRNGVPDRDGGYALKQEWL